LSEAKRFPGGGRYCRLERPHPKNPLDFSTSPQRGGESACKLSAMPAHPARSTRCSPWSSCSFARPFEPQILEPSSIPASRCRYGHVPNGLISVLHSGAFFPTPPPPPGCSLGFLKARLPSPSPLSRATFRDGLETQNCAFKRSDVHDLFQHRRSRGPHPGLPQLREENSIGCGRRARGQKT